MTPEIAPVVSSAGPPPQSTSTKASLRARRWPRLAVATKLADFETDAARGASHRAWAEAGHVPRSTSQNWIQRKACIASKGTVGSAELVAFFESPAGLAFLHRLVFCLLLVFTEAGPFGRRRVALALDLLGLAPFVAISDGSLHKLGVALEEAIIAYEEDCRPALAKQMVPKRITACQDETFHPQICLVAAEPDSDFILLEKYVEKRDAATWSTEMKKALEGLSVTVIQSTSDEGSGLLGYVKNEIGAHHSPDLFHCQHDLSKATSIALAGQTRRAEEAVAAAIAFKEALQENEKEWSASLVAPDFAPRFAQADVDRKNAEQALEAARALQERAGEAIRGVGDDYHPVDLSTGGLLKPDAVGEKLEARFEDIKAVAKEAGLGEQHLKLIAKARRLLPAFVSTLAFFCSEVATRIAALGLAPDQQHAVERYLVPLAYLERVANKARDADSRERLRELIARLRASPPAFAAALNLLPAAQLAVIHAVAWECAAIFQRSSSCIEGRNGQLSLYHHGLHSLSDRKLRVLTILHNYFIRRDDGTTAAERFFGPKPPELFGWILSRLPMPARPRSARAVAA